uniref:Neurotransmitter-gated ion-channel ligand-binding domain-containing protein n=1 Tax=Plectus sambesii TaxID=2011161 RepID=A0A914X7X4_9BILA
MELSVTAECEVNFRNYPNDEHTCCFTIEDKNFDSKIKFDLTAPGIETQRSFRANGWYMKSANVETKKRTDGYAGEILEVCVLMERVAGTLSADIWVPIIISAVVLISSPFFGALKIQLFVKMFSLLLQFLCFQLLVKRTPQIGVGLDEAPKVYRFYDLTIIISTAGLLTTLILHALTNRERRFPPQHDLCLAAKTINNRFLCCMSDKSVDSFGDDINGEWLHIFVALNAIISLLILSLYILGCLLIVVA